MASRRTDVEGASYGGFARIVDEEVAKRFVPIDAVAELMAAHVSTARRWVRREDPRFIVRHSKKLYCREDVQAMIATRQRQSEAASGSSAGGAA